MITGTFCHRHQAGDFLATVKVKGHYKAPLSDAPDFLWLSLLRKGDFVEIRYSSDGQQYNLLRLAFFRPAKW